MLPMIMDLQWPLAALITAGVLWWVLRPLFTTTSVVADLLGAKQQGAARPDEEVARGGLSKEELVRAYLASEVAYGRGEMSKEQWQMRKSALQEAYVARTLGDTSKNR